MKVYTVGITSNGTHCPQSALRIFATLDSAYAAVEEMAGHKVAWTVLAPDTLLGHDMQCKWLKYHIVTVKMEG